MDHLERRIEQLTETLGRKPSFLPVGREDIRLLCQRYIDQSELPMIEMTIRLKLPSPGYCQARWFSISEALKLYSCDYQQRRIEMSVYQCKYFPLKELVPPEMMMYPDHRLWRLFDPVGLFTLDALRARYGKMYVNSHRKGLKYCGYRPPECEIGNMFSQHRFGRGFDPHPTMASSEEIRADIKSLTSEERKSFNLDGIRRMETDISWLHFDTGNYGLVEGKILFFKP